MRLYKCAFPVIILCVYWQESAAETNSTNVTVTDDAKKQPVTLELVKLKKLVPRNTTVDNSKKSTQNVGQKREVPNGTFNPFESLLLFPILPFLFPPMEELPPPEGNELPVVNDNKEKPQERGKPFVFFDFAFNIREIPVKNASERANDSKIINVKTTKEDAKGTNRKRRDSKHEGDLFDETFPDTELDEFLPKTDLFFPDLSFRPKPVKKLSRKKRDEKPETKSDFKSFLDAFDEAFMRTKKELERTDPILNFIKGMESSFGDEKKDSNEEENPNVKWKMERDVKRLNDGGDSLGKAEDNPMIIMDKVVKIGEFRLHGDKHEGKKSKRKRKRDSEKRKSFGDLTDEEIDDMSIRDMFSQDSFKNLREEKINHLNKLLGEDVKEIPLQPRINATRSTSAKNDTEKDANTVKQINPTEDVTKEVDPGDKTKPKRKKASYEDLKKNITQILNQFLGFVKKVDEDEAETKAGSDDYQGDLGLFDWTEKEILDTKTRKKKEFPLEYVDTKKQERQIADIHKNIMFVTVPSVIIIIAVLMACIWALQPKGRCCRLLFRPRKVYMMAEEEHHDQATKRSRLKNVPIETAKPDEKTVEVHEQTQ